MNGYTAARQASSQGSLARISRKTPHSSGRALWLFTLQHGIISAGLSDWGLIPGPSFSWAACRDMFVDGVARRTRQQNRVLQGEGAGFCLPGWKGSLRAIQSPGASAVRTACTRVKRNSWRLFIVVYGKSSRINSCTLGNLRSITCCNLLTLLLFSAGKMLLRTLQSSMLRHSSKTTGSD